MSQVKWLGEDGGWRIGEVVKVDGRPFIDSGYRRNYDSHVLVKQEYTGKLEMVDEAKLSPYPSRTERGEEPYGSDTVKREPVDLERPTTTGRSFLAKGEC